MKDSQNRTQIPKDKESKMPEKGEWERKKRKRGNWPNPTAQPAALNGESAPSTEMVNGLLGEKIINNII